MNQRPDIPLVVEIDGNTDLNPLILGLASMLVQRIISRAKAAPVKPEA